jgi:hypothetical protein
VYTHEINKHKAAVWRGWEPPKHQQQYPAVAGRSRRWNTFLNQWEDDVEPDNAPRRLHRPNEMGKMEFAMYVRNSNLKKGDLVASKWSKTPYHARGVYRIKDIQEIHHFVSDWGTAESGPYILTLQSVNPKEQTIQGGPGMYTKVIGNDIPDEWTQLLLSQELPPDYGC